VFDPLYDAGSSCSESCDLGVVVKVLALGDEEGGDSPRVAARTPSSMGASRSAPRAGNLGCRHRGPMRTTRPRHRPRLGH
jgi:hypothetical protein